MPNHVHLVLTPNTESGLRTALAEAHRRYTRRVNFRYGWRGHLWQKRFHSFPMNETHLAAAIRYVELNPMRAIVSGLGKLPTEPAQDDVEYIRVHTRTGRPLGDAPFIQAAESLTCWILTPQKPGRKPGSHSAAVNGK